MMKAKLFGAGFFVALLVVAFSSINPALAAQDDGKEEDTQTRLVQAKVVEVTETRVSVFARTGVEHVIAVDRAGTRVLLDGRTVSLKDLREGDVVTIELDADSDVKFAKNIEIRVSQMQVARNRR